ncbi:metal ABC transporter permease [Kytococcus sp. Marseille-QA3725]
MLEMWDLDFMRRALVAALLIGLTAPMVGIFVVQRGMSLIGDAIGHVALAGVAIGVVLNQAPVGVALVVSVFAAVVVELVKHRGGAASDVALALLFYTGIALGVVLISSSSAGADAMLTSYLFGAITTTTSADLVTFGVLAALVAGTTLLLRPRLFAVAQDETFSRAQGLPVLGLNILLSALVAMTVVMSMRVVGLLLISALMVVPNAAAQRLTHSFAAAWWIALVLGVVSSVGGVALSYEADLPSGGTIVLLAVGLYALVALVTGVLHALRVRHHRRAPLGEHQDHEHGTPDCDHPAVPHGDHVDHVHDGHLHHPHGAHYDERPLDLSTSTVQEER